MADHVDLLIAQEDEIERLKEVGRKLRKRGRNDRARIRSLEAQLEEAEERERVKGLEEAIEASRVKAHGWRNEANTLEQDTDEWRELIAKAEAGEGLSVFLKSKGSTDAKDQ